MMDAVVCCNAVGGYGAAVVPPVTCFGTSRLKVAFALLDEVGRWATAFGPINHKFDRLAGVLIPSIVAQCP